MGAARQLDKRQRIRQADEASRLLGGSRGKQRYDLPLRQLRAKEGSARRTGTPNPGVLGRVDPILNSYALPCCFELLPEFTQSGTDSCLHGPKRLIQLCRDLLVSPFGEERAFDYLPLLRRDDLQGVLQCSVLLLNLPGLLLVTFRSLSKWMR